MADLFIVFISPFFVSTYFRESQVEHFGTVEIWEKVNKPLTSC